jgi:hypothetical protein
MVEQPVGVSLDIRFSDRMRAALTTDPPANSLPSMPGDKVFPEELVDQNAPIGQIKNYQYYFAGRWAVAASTSDGIYESPGSGDLHATSLEIKNIDLYEQFVDTQAPTISGVPADKVVEATGPSGAVVIWTAPTATDLVDGAVTPVCSPPSGSTFPLGDTTVSITATDAAGNSSSKSFKVTVTPNISVKIWRFYNMRTGTHFHTADVAEKDNVVATLSSIYRLEGVAYSVNTANPANSSPLYRFYNVVTGVHFYTADVAERDRIIATTGLPDAWAIRAPRSGGE